MAVVNNPDPVTIEKTLKTPQTIAAPELTITKKGSVTVTVSSSAEEELKSYAVYMNCTDSALKATLNGNLSVTDKLANVQHDTYGLKLANEATIITDNAAKISVTRTLTSKDTSEDPVSVYGIALIPDPLVFEEETKSLAFSNTFLDTVTVSVTNSATGKDASAYGIYNSGKISFAEDLAAAVSATATACQSANACAFYFSSAEITDDITKNITATANSTSKDKDESSGSSIAYGFYGVYVPGEENEDGNITIGGALSGAVKATATSKRISASADAFNGKNITISDGITKDITAAATANSITYKEEGITYTVGGSASAYGFNAGGTVSAKILSGAVKATATGKAGSAHAKAISGTEITISGGITKDITATATASTSSESSEEVAEAYGIDGTSVTIGNVAGNITATATGNGSASASAYAVEADTVTINGNITKNLTAIATANSLTYKEDETTYTVGGSASAYGIAAYESGEEQPSLKITGVLSGAVKATATGKANSAHAEAISGTEITISGGITKDITATATATGYEIGSTAYGINGTSVTIGNEETVNAVAGSITATATGNTTANATAYALYADTFAITGNITKNITATATANSVTQKNDNYKYISSGSAYAYGIGSSSNITGTLSGVVKATATSKANSASAMAVYGSTVIAGGIAKDITAAATASGGDLDSGAEAYGIYSESSVQIGTEDKTANAVAGNITATATGNSRLGEDGEGLEVSATAYALNANTFTMYGNLTKNITATATANSVSYKEDGIKYTVSGKATAYGIYANELNIDGDITGTIKATATSKASDATVYGICSEKISVDSKLGTVNVTGSGAGNSDTYGWKTSTLNYTGDQFTGKASVTSKNGMAVGLSVGKITNGENESCNASLNITSTGYEAFGIQFTGSATLNLKNSSITAKSTGKDWKTAYAIHDSSSDKQNLSLIKSTLTGDVLLGGGDDALVLSGKSKITGAVIMGDGQDQLVIESGSLIKGAVSGVETATLELTDNKSAGSVLWEGTDFEAASIALDINKDALSKVTGKKKQVFSLLKDTDGATWDNETKLTLNLGDGQTEIAYDGDAVELGGYEFQLSGKKSGKSVTMQLTVSKL